MEEDIKTVQPDRPALDSEVHLPPRKKWGGIRGWWKCHKPSKRRLIQVYAALLTNANLKGFFSGRIYSGDSKNICAPGLNCYSCPGAVAACPLGSLQNGLAQSGARVPYYIIGIIMLFGLALARTICGFLCPIGLGQELLYKIKTPKLKKSRFTRLLSYLKYVILAVFVIAVPLIYGLVAKTAVPAFCKYICPAGTLGGGIALLSNPANADMYQMLGELFTWKFCVLIGIIAASIFIYRVFCRFLCPLGAIYGFFNRFSLLGVKVDMHACTDCGLCVSKCKMDIRKVGDHECINCGECIPVCPAKAISWKGSSVFVNNPLPAPAVAAEAAGAISAPVAGGQIILSTESENTGTAEAPKPEDVSPVGTPEPEKALKRGRGRTFWLKIAAFGVAIAVLVGALVYYNFIAKEPETGGNSVGEVCMDFTLDAYCGEEDFTLSDYRGKIVFINFWATWCGPCVAELPEFQRLTEKYGDDIEVVAVHSSQITEDVQAYIDSQRDVYDSSRTWKDWNIHFVQDEGDDMNSRTFAALGGKDSYPYTMIVDRDGVIRFIRPGSVTYELLSGQLEILLALEQT